MSNCRVITYLFSMLLMYANFYCSYWLKGGSSIFFSPFAVVPEVTFLRLQFVTCSQSVFCIYSHVLNLSTSLCIISHYLMFVFVYLFEYTGGI
jgi:hypothetical protein